MNNFIDLNHADAVQIQIGDNGKKLWINVDGVCKLRLCDIEFIEVEDSGGNYLYRTGKGTDRFEN